MAANFNQIRHGAADTLDALLDSQPMSEQVLRAALQNVLGMVVQLQNQVLQLHKENGTVVW